MSSQATLSSKGQITIPQEVREQLGLKTGDKVEFVAEAGIWSIRPIRQSPNPFESYAGALGAFENADEVNAWQSDMRDE